MLKRMVDPVTNIAVIEVYRETNWDQFQIESIVLCYPLGDADKSRYEREPNMDAWTIGPPKRPTCPLYRSAEAFMPKDGGGLGTYLGSNTDAAAMIQHRVEMARS